MALRDQPYLPLFIQDFLTDEKLIECSAAATGVFIRIMCVMHKSETYGKILLRQNDRQNDRQILNFADKLAKHLPYTLPIIVDGLVELIDAGCLNIEGDFLIQKRMVRDNEISLKRSKSGSKGANVTNQKNKNNINFADKIAAAKSSANSEYEYEYEYENRIEKEGEGEKREEGPQKPIGSEKVAECARSSWDDQRWRESICMGHAITLDQLKKWMAQFNASICNDAIHDFDPGKYKKLFGGWLNKQRAKGYTLPETGVQQKSGPTLRTL